MNSVLELLIKFFKQLTEGIGDVWFWGILPVYFFIYTLIAFIAVRFTGGSTVTRGIRDFRHRSAIYFIRQYMKRFWKIAGVVTVLMIILPTFLMLNLKYDIILESLGSNISNLSSIVIGLTTMVLTVSVVIILFHKNYYLVFSISDVLKSFHFNGCIGILLANCLGFCGCALWQLYLKEDAMLNNLVMLIMEWCVLCCFAASGISFWIIFRVMFSNRKVELRQLKHLYQIFRGGEKPDDSQTLSASQWEEGAMRTNVEYLCAEYISAARNVPIHKVRRLSFLSGEERQQPLKNLCRRTRISFILFALAAWIISMTLVGIVLGTEGTGFLILDTILLAVVVLSAYFASRRGSLENMQTIFDDILGYEMEVEGKKKIRIPRIKLRPANRYDRFIRTMNSLTAFFCIALERGMRPEMTDRAMGIIVDWLSDVKEKHSCIYLPVFSAGYYAFAYGQKPETAAKCYEKLIKSPEKEETGKSQGSGILLSDFKQASEKITGTSREEIDEMIRGHLADLTGAQLPCAFSEAVSADAYILWLRSCMQD